MLDDNSLLGEAITAAYTDRNKFVAEEGRTVTRRMGFEHAVRNILPFDRTAYTTLVNYEGVVMPEVSKRMKASDLKRSKILSGVVDALVRTEVNASGELHDVTKQCDTKKDSTNE